MNILNELAEKLDTSIELLWGVLVKQQYINAITHFVLAILLTLIIIISLILVPKHLEKLDNTLDEYGFSTYSSSKAFFITVVVILAVVVFIQFVIGIKMLYNPEYYALKEILENL